jgi:hypothetical protein
MNIEISDRDLEARIQKQIQATGAASAEEALLRLLETQEDENPIPFLSRRVGMS